MGMTIAVQPMRGVVASNCVLQDAPRQTKVSRTRSAPLILAAVLAAAIPEAHSQNATPPAGQSANPSSGASSSPGASEGTPKSGTPAPAATKVQGTAPVKGAAPAVCFPLTGHCVEGSKAPAAKAGMNLTAPDVKTVVSADELKEPLPTNEQITEVQEDQTVSVKGEGVPADVPLGFGAIWWALNHPSQAWRILTPAE